MTNQKNIFRTVNAVIAAIIAVFFLIHAFLGGLSLTLPDFTSNAEKLIWAMVILAVIHIAVSLLTSGKMLFDKENPPSSKKKAHLALKWMSGIILLLIAGEHIAVATGVMTSTAGLESANSFNFISLIVVAVLAWHICVGAKSLLSDLRLSTDRKAFLRKIVIILAVVIAAILITSLFMA